MKTLRLGVVMRVCKCIHEGMGCEYCSGLADLLFLLLLLFLLVGRVCFGYTTFYYGGAY